MNSFLKLGLKNADDVARMLLPAIKQMGNSDVARKAVQGLRRMGADIPGFVDDIAIVPKRTPGYQAPRPAFGTREIPRDMGPGLIGQGADDVNAAIARVRASQAPVPEFGPGVIPPGARPDTLLTRMRTGTPTRPMGPGQPGRTPLEGTQLRIGMTQPGKGAQMYSAKKSSVNPENVARSMGRSIADESAEEFAKGAAREAAEAGLVQGPGRYNMGDGSPLPAVLRNAAAGAETVDLNALLKAAGMTGAAVGAGGLVGIASRMGGDPTGETTERVPTPSTPLLRENDGTVLGDMPSEVVPSNPPSVGNIDPTPPQEIVTTGGEERDSVVREALAQSDPMAAAINRAMEPMSPEKYTPERGGIAQYYADREAYARSGPARKQVGDMLAVAMEADPNMKTWAQANPGLAYELVRRQMVDPNANQQSAEAITTTTTNTSLGSDLEANALGNAEAAGEATVNPNQGSYDIEAATNPITQPVLERVDQYQQIMRRRGF